LNFLFARLLVYTSVINLFSATLKERRSWSTDLRFLLQDIIPAYVFSIITTKTRVADMHNVSRKTVAKWCKRAHHRGKERFKDKKPEMRGTKISLKVELSIIALVPPSTLFCLGHTLIKFHLGSIDQPAHVHGLIYG
jgi:transposase-like protein